MSTLDVELEEIEIQVEQLKSFLLMLEQALINDIYGGKQLLPAVSKMADIAEELLDKITKLRQATKLKEVGQA